MHFLSICLNDERCYIGNEVLKVCLDWISAAKIALLFETRCLQAYNLMKLIKKCLAQLAQGCFQEKTRLPDVGIHEIKK